MVTDRGKHTAAIVAGCPRCKGHYRWESDRYGSYWTCDNCGYASDIETAEGDLNPMQDMVYVGTTEAYKSLTAGLRIKTGTGAAWVRYEMDSHEGFIVYCPMLTGDKRVKNRSTACGLDMKFQEMEHIQGKSGRFRKDGKGITAAIVRPTMRYSCDQGHSINVTQSHMGWL